MQMQSRKVFFLTLFVAISTLVFSACLPKKDEAKSDEVQQQAEKSGDSSSFSGNLKDLIGFGKAQKCTWETEEGISGEVYTDGTRSYFEMKNVPVADFNGNNEVEKGSMYTVSDKEYVYSWSSASKEGMKFKNEDEDFEDQEDSIIFEEDMDDGGKKEFNAMVEDYNYKCSSWRVDSSKFDLPTDIKFQDLSVMMDDLKDDMKDMVKLCDMLEGQDKEDCIRDFAEVQ